MNPENRIENNRHSQPGRFLRASFTLYHLLLLCAFVGGGSRVSGSTLQVESSQNPKPATCNLQPFGESNAVALLTSTLQRDYVKDRGKLELIFTQPWTAPQLPQQALTLKILELPTVGVTPSFIVRFQLCTADRTLGTWQVSVQAHVWRDVWVAHANLQRGDLVSSSDIARERRDVLNIHEALADFPANDPSLEFAEPVPAGVPLLARMVRPRTVIHRGQMADALVQDGELSITMKVQALEDGATGQIIRARNPVSMRYLSGRVLDAHTIRIAL